MANLVHDQSHLRSAALADVVPRGLGNTATGRFLREHERILSAHFERVGIEMTEFTRILIARLGRIALQISEMERRVDRERKLSEAEYRIYSSVSAQYTGIMRELLLHPHKQRRPQFTEPGAVRLGDDADEPRRCAFLARRAGERDGASGGGGRCVGGVPDSYCVHRAARMGARGALPH